MGTLKSSLALKVVAAVAAITLVGIGVGAALWANSASDRAASAYKAKRSHLDASIATAVQQGYTAQDLAPVVGQVGGLDSGRAPWLVLDQPSYYDSLARRTDQLQSQLTTLEQQVLDQARTSVQKQTDAAKAAIAQLQQANAADLDVTAMQQRLDAAARGEGAAHTLKDYRAAAQQAQAVAQDAATLLSGVQQENQQIQQAAQQLLSQDAGNIGTIQQAGNQAVADANNNASVIAYLSKEIAFKGADYVARTTSRLAKYVGLIGSSDVNQAALGAAAATTFSGQIRSALYSGLPAKAVIVSFTDQHVWAFENQKVVMDNPVTTGIRGVGDYGTDFGPMKILHKDHPWKFQSPWPKGSPHWYPDTVVQWTAFFTVTGEAFHDASWQPDSTLGPGSQYTQGLQSHGCIHLPANLAQWMYNWADVGMPVIVYPGDGTAVSNQLSQITTNDQGIPHSAGG